MAFISNRISMDDVKDSGASTIYYAMHTCWWTHDPAHLYKLPDGSGLPCDPRGSVLMMTSDVAGFLADAEANPEHYGRHGLRAFMAAHALNCQVSRTDERQTSLRTWAEYNDALDSSTQDKPLARPFRREFSSPQEVRKALELNDAKRTLERLSGCEVILLPKDGSNPVLSDFIPSTRGMASSRIALLYGDG